VLGECGILQGNPPGRVVNIGPVTIVTAAAVVLLTWPEAGADVVGVRLGAVDTANRTP
jgi:hypothetical protein